MRAVKPYPILPFKDESKVVRSIAFGSDFVNAGRGRAPAFKPVPRILRKKTQTPTIRSRFSPTSDSFVRPSFMRRLPVILATTHILFCGLIFGSAIANPLRAGLLPLMALAIDWPASLAFNGLSDLLIGFPPQ